MLLQNAIYMYVTVNVIIRLSVVLRLLEMAKHVS